MDHSFSDQIKVDYGKSFAAMVDEGNYTWVSGDATAKHFPIEGQGVVDCDVRLFHITRFESSERVVEKIRQVDAANPWQPARWEHVLALGAQYPDEQTKSPIPALGSIAVIRGKRGVLCIFGGGTKRNVRVDPWDGDWALSFGFLAVRKPA